MVRFATLDGPVLSGWATWDRAFSSRLAFVEVSRALVRLRLLARLDPEELVTIAARTSLMAAGIERVSVTEEVLTLASESLPVHVKTLDAVHLASAIVIRASVASDVVFATHDKQLAAAASAFGFSVVGI